MHGHNISQRSLSGDFSPTPRPSRLATKSPGKFSERSSSPRYGDTLLQRALDRMHPSPGPAAYNTLWGVGTLSTQYTSRASMSQVGRRWIDGTPSPGPKYLPDLVKTSSPRYCFPTASRFPCSEKEQSQTSSLSYRPNYSVCSRYISGTLSSSPKLYTVDKFHGVHHASDGPGPAGYFPSIKYTLKDSGNSYMSNSPATRNSYILNSPFF